MTTKTIQCAYCGEIVPAERITKKFCSPTCAQRSKRNFPKTRECLQCGTEFGVVTRSDANRKYCSQTCAKKHHTKRVKAWVDAHPGVSQKYNQTRLKKNPGAWSEQKRKERLEIINLLGGQCIVCGVSNPNWLHVDFVETTRGKPYRHPRHVKYVREHLTEFRLLCANHHYELTLTGKVEGTEITQ